MNNVAQTIELRNELVRHLKEPSDIPCKVVIVGAGATGVELAGSLPEFAGMVAKKFKLKNPRGLNVELLEHSGHILPKMTNRVAHKASQRLEKLGVEVSVNSSVTGFFVRPGGAGVSYNYS